MCARQRAEDGSVQHRYERISIDTPRHRIIGIATMASDGYRSRLSDLLNAPEREFIALTEATVESLDGDFGVAKHDFIAVHRQHVVFAVSLGTVEQSPTSDLLA
jgi:hypothetical protein